MAQFAPTTLPVARICGMIAGSRAGRRARGSDYGGAS
jgi:hypothetical protein